MEKIEKIEKVVMETIADSLALEMDEFSPSSKIFVELEVNSLDFLDIIFTLESEFDIQIRGEEFDLITRSDVPIDSDRGDENFSGDALEVLKKWIPEIANLPEPEKATRRDFFTLMSVQSLIDLVQRKVGEDQS